MGDHLESTTAAPEPGEVFAGVHVQVTRNNDVDMNDPDNLEWICSDEENGGIHGPDKPLTTPLAPVSQEVRKPRQKQEKKIFPSGGTLMLNPAASEFHPWLSSQLAQPDQTDNYALGHGEQQTTQGLVFHTSSSSRTVSPAPMPEQQHKFSCQGSTTSLYPATNQSRPFDMSEYLAVVEQHLAVCKRCWTDPSYLSFLTGHIASCQNCQVAFQDYMDLSVEGYRNNQMYGFTDPWHFASIHMPWCSKIRESVPDPYSWDEEGSVHCAELKGWDRNGLYTQREHEEYLADENELEGVEEESNLWWAIRSGRAQDAAEIIFMSIGMSKGLTEGDSRWQAMTKAESTAASSSRTISVGASSVTTVDAEAEAESAKAEGSMRLRGGGYPHIPGHESRSKDWKHRYGYKRGAGEGAVKGLRKMKIKSLDVVREEDDAVADMAGTTGWRHDTSVVTEERGCAGVSEASVSKRLSVSAGEGIVEEGFEVVSVTGLADTNGSRTKEGKLHRQHRPVDQKDSRRQQQTKDQDGKSSSKGGKKRGARSWLASWIPWRSAPSSASKSIKKSATDVKMDGQSKRSSPKGPPTPPARGSSSRAGDLKVSTMIHDTEVTANKDDEPRTSTDQVSTTSSWSMVDDNNSDSAGNSADTSDTSIEMVQEDKTAATTQITNDGVARNEADTTAAEPEEIDYAAMVGEAGDYFWNPYCTDSGRKDKGVAKDEDLTYRYHNYTGPRPGPFPQLFGTGYYRHLGGFKTPFLYRSWHHGAIADVKDQFGRSLGRDARSPAGGLSMVGDGQVGGQLNGEKWDREEGFGREGMFEQARQHQGHGTGHQRKRLPLDQTGPPPVPEVRRHRASQAAAVAALSQGEMWGYGSGLQPPPGFDYPKEPRGGGVPDIFGNDIGGDRCHGETGLPSYGEVIMQDSKNKAEKALEQARKKARFSMPTMPDIPRGLGRLVGRVIGHGERGEERIEGQEEEDDEEGGVVEHREFAGGESEGLGKGSESHSPVYRFGRQRR